MLWYRFQFLGASCLTDAMDKLDSIEQGIRAGGSAVFYFAALFQGTVGNRLIRKIDTLRGQFQRFRNSTTRIGKREVKQNVRTSARSCVLAAAMNLPCSSAVRYFRFPSKVNSSLVICSLSHVASSYSTAVLW